MSSGPGLYLHVPFCARICPYCDFAVRTGTAAARARFVDSLTREISRQDPGGWGRFDTIYFGGGTPSMLEPAQLGQLLDRVRGRLAVADDAWIFLEANPEDVTPARATAWRGLGVRTLSLGLQALEESRLTSLGRRHTAAQGAEAVAVARAAGFDTVAFDLIYGTPGQREADWREELERAVALGPDHLSCYQLTVHEGTPLARRLPAELPETAQASLFALTHQLLAEAGIAPYEVSNFAAAPAHRSRHNRKYWTHVPYLGLGPSAHSFDGRRRWWNLRRLPDYRAALAAGRAPVEESERLTDGQLALEALMLGLRTTAGVDLAAFEARFGFDLLAANRALVDRCLAEDQLALVAGRLAPTLAGLAIADGLSAAFNVSAVGAVGPDGRSRCRPRRGRSGSA